MDPPAGDEGWRKEAKARLKAKLGRVATTGKPGILVGGVGCLLRIVSFHCIKAGYDTDRTDSSDAAYEDMSGKKMADAAARMRTYDHYDYLKVPGGRKSENRKGVEQY